MIFTLIKFSTQPSGSGGGKNMNSILDTRTIVKPVTWTSETSSDNQGLPSKTIIHDDYKVSSKIASTALTDSLNGEL